MPKHARANDLTVSALIGLAILAVALAVVSRSGRYYGHAERLHHDAGRYLQLVADLGAHDPDSVDFHIAATDRHASAPRALRAIAVESRSLAAHLRRSHRRDEPVAERAIALAAQLEAVAARADRLSGSKLTFEDELRLLALDRAVARPETGAEDRARLQRLLPGDDALSRRLARYQRRFSVPRARLDATMTRSIELCRNQTRRFLTLPPGETVSVEYVADRVWSGYSVYLGHYRSVLQVNRELALSVKDVLTLACHEGYPGHHVYNSLREEQLVHARGWTELNALPLFSPAGFRAEAVTSAAASMAFTTAERAWIFRDALFPIVGLDASEASRYAEVCELADRLEAATAPVLRAYLAGEMRRIDVEEALREAALMEYPDALVAYVDRYRAYSLAYTLGRNRVLTALTGAGGDRDQWTRLQQIIVGDTAVPLPERNGKRP